MATVRAPGAVKSSCPSEARLADDGGTKKATWCSKPERYTTLLDLRYRRVAVLKAESGENGRSIRHYGKGGEDLVVQVPPGTQVTDDETCELLADLEQHGTRVDHRPGWTRWTRNIHFVTSVNQSPNRAEKRRPRAKTTRAAPELKLLADVGLLGYPNVGRASFISAVSRAPRRSPDYPFHDPGPWCPNPRRGFAG